jgi:zinc protease
VKKLWTLFFACMVIGIFFVPTAHAFDPTIRALGGPPVGEIHYPPVTVEDLPNGMRVYLLEDHELPTLEVFAYIRGGSIFDPKDQVGLASMVGTVLRTGGTLKRPVEEIDRLLEDHGADLDTGMGSEYGTASLRCLSQHTQELLPLFFEVLASPRFDPKQIDLARVQKVEALRRQNDSAEKIASREFPQLLYGKENVWARMPSAQSLGRVRREDLIRYHERFYHPDRVILAVAGDFQKDALLRLIQASTQGWGKAGEPLPSVEPVQKKWEGGLFGVAKKGAQSTLLIGHFGEKRFNPDKFALILMNYMLGGDIFSSRLGEEVRSDRGLAYTVYSHFGLETDYGLFYAVAQTQSDATGEVIALIQKVIQKFHDGEGFTESSLKDAKEAILNQLVADWEPRFNYVKERARLYLLGYPENYLEIYRKSLDAVTLNQVKDVAKKYLFPDRLKILVVGDLDHIDGQLQKIGELKKIPLENF